MQRYLLVVVCAVVLVGFATQPGHAQTGGYRLVADWPTVPSGTFLALLTSKWVEVQVGATRSYAIWAVTA